MGKCKSAMPMCSLFLHPGNVAVMRMGSATFFLLPWLGYSLVNRYFSEAMEKVSQIS